MRREDESLLSRATAERPIDVADLVDLGGPLHARIDQLAVVGDLGPVRDQPLAIFSEGVRVATVDTEAGQATLPAGLAGRLGVCRVGAGGPDDPSEIEQWVAVLRPGAGPLVVFDAELTDAVLREIPRRFEGAELIAVRLRPSRSCRSIRARQRALGLPPYVVDARAVLDEGEALDVSDLLDPVRLARVASRLLAAGFRVTAIVHGGPMEPWSQTFAVLSGPRLEAAPARAEPISPALTAGNRIELELDNATARGWLVEAISRSARTLHLQIYMALDDEIGGLVEAALSAAQARGVAVRVLVDSLHGLHGSFGARNPLFDRLASRGIEVRASRPITELPSITDLKQRDHRKLVVADGQRALVGGRNLSHEYYTGFGEVQLRPDSTWREVPWLDAGARIEGPAVAVLEASFREAWTDAGGAGFEVAAAAVAGTSAARVLVHRGLRDTRTLEAYLELIRGARADLFIVNGFPLLLELQHALVGALRRGVRVRTLIGHMTPTHGSEAFTGTWAAARMLATELVHSRMDPVVAAGGEVYVFARRELPGWAPGLGLVQPHVHAKAISADGLRCAVGSANLDVTASYWESELMLLVEDPVVVSGFEEQIEALLAGSIRVRREDPQWQQAARRRTWLRHWPGVLSV